MVTPRAAASRGIAFTVGLCVAALGSHCTAKPVATKATLTVYKSPTCGCCAKWNAHMTAAGHGVVSHDVADVDAVKDEHKVPAALRSCHTAIVDGYVVEGHVPADVVAKLLAEKPAGVVGIAVPDMPAGSPGMESADGTRTPYTVMAFTGDGQARVYASR